MMPMPLAPSGSKSVTAKLRVPDGALRHCTAGDWLPPPQLFTPAAWLESIVPPSGVPGDVTSKASAATTCVKPEESANVSAMAASRVLEIVFIGRLRRRECARAFTTASGETNGHARLFPRPLFQRNTPDFWFASGNCRVSRTDFGCQSRAPPSMPAAFDTTAAFDGNSNVRRSALPPPIHSLS